MRTHLASFARSFACVASLLGVASAATSPTWESSPAFPVTGAREFAVGLQYQGDLFAIGGSPFTANDDGVSHRLPNGGSAWSIAPIVEGSIIHHGAAVDALGRIVVFGGAAAIGDDEGKVYVWDPIEGKKGTLPDRSSAAPPELFAWATDDVGRIYSLGGGPGASATPQNPNVGYVERFDAVGNEWQPLSPMPMPVADAAAVYDGKGYVLVIGGYVASGGGRTGNVARYEVATDTWSDTAVPDLPVALSGHRAVRGSDDRIYVMGGTNGSVQAKTWVLDADAIGWTAGPDMAVAREGFAAALAADDHVYAMGGSDGGIGTNLCERLYTPPCPQFTASPADTTTFVGMTVTLSVSVAGGAPFSYRWRKDGLLLSDGTTQGGGFVSGSTSDTLVLIGATTYDAGAYDVIATNGCGSTTSDPADVAILVPPAPGATWSAWSLHPAGSLSSVAYGVSDDRIGGGASYPHPQYGSTEHPMLWPLDGGAALDLTPANSAGGSILAVEDGVQVGWWWSPYTTPQGTGYNKSACMWTGNAASHLKLQPQGWEFGSAAGTDGVHHVGTARFDESSTHSDGFYWYANHTSPLKLTPTGMWGSSASGIYGDHQYGSVVLPFASVHAARWSGSAATFVDIHPSGSTYSYVADADLGQQVGTATFGGVNHAGIWADTANSFLDIHPAGASSSEAKGVHEGLQCGSVAIDGTNHAALWAGPGSTWIDLHTMLDPSFTSSSANDVTVDENGTITVVGSGYDSATARTEALVWRTNPVSLSGDVDTIVAASGGQQSLTLFAPEHAGKQYFVLGTLSGPSPGLALNPWLTLPLNYDFYLSFTLTHPNSAVLYPSLGTIGANGIETVTFAVPPTAVPFPIMVHHAAVVLDGSNAPVATTNAAAVMLE